MTDVTEGAQEELAESERSRLLADRDAWYELAMEYLRQLQELQAILHIIRGNVTKAERIAQGKEGGN